MSESECAKKKGEGVKGGSGGDKEASEKTCPNFDAVESLLLLSLRTKRNTLTLT